MLSSVFLYYSLAIVKSVGFQLCHPYFWDVREDNKINKIKEQFQFLVWFSFSLTNSYCNFKA